jgi:hypothetical protein
MKHNNYGMIGGSTTALEQANEARAQQELLGRRGDGLNKIYNSAA